MTAMPKKVDLVGQRFGKKVVLALAGKEAGSYRRVWLARCDYDEWRELGRVIRGWRQAASEIPESRTGTSAPFVANEPPTIPNGHVHDVVNAPGIVNLNGPGWVPTVAPGPHDGSHWTVSASDVRPTYDERRSDLKPCKCGAIFTHPHLCDARGTCEAAKHPHFRRQPHPVK